MIVPPGLVRFFKNTILLFAARLMNPAAAVIVGLVFAKRDGVEPFGEFSFVLAYCFLFGVVFSLGLGTLIGREAAKEPEKSADYLASATFISLVSAAAGGLCMFAPAGFFHLSGNAKWGLFIMGLSIFPSILIFVWEALLITMERNNQLLAYQGVEGLLKVSLSLPAIHFGYGIIGVTSVFLFARLVCAAGYFGVLRSALRPMSWKVNPETVRKLLFLTPTFALLHILAVVFAKSDIVLLALLSDFNAVGIYGAAYKLLEMTFIPPTCVVSVLFPILSRHAKENGARFTEISSLSVFYSVAVLLPVAAVLIYFADFIVVTVYSKSFAGAAHAFRILIIALAFYMVDQVFAHSLVASDLQGNNLRALAIGTVIGVGLNAALIPSLGYIGPCISTVVSMGALTMIHYYYVGRRLYRFNAMKTALGAAVIGALGFLAYLSRSASPFILIPACLAVYVPVVLLIKAHLFECSDAPEWAAAFAKASPLPAEASHEAIK
ncbi:MAG: flippase [Syntrophobacteraceae bacterium]